MMWMYLVAPKLDAAEHLQYPMVPLAVPRGNTSFKSEAKSIGAMLLYIIAIKLTVITLVVKKKLFHFTSHELHTHKVT